VDVEKERTSEQLAREAESLVESKGYKLVDFNLTRRGRSTHIAVVIYSPGGTGIDECSAVHRLLHARFQVLLGEAEPSLEVSSPGMEREFRSPREYLIFQGRGVKAYSRAKSDWVRGILASFDGETVVIATEKGPEGLNLADIAKARLDYSQEVR
jgi:ribosome maturation factor RimP